MRHLKQALLPAALLVTASPARGIAIMDAAHAWPPSPDGYRQWAEAQLQRQIAEIDKSDASAQEKASLKQQTLKEGRAQIEADLQRGHRRGGGRKLRVDPPPPSVGGSAHAVSPEEAARIAIEQVRRYQVGNYMAWWDLNRDQVLLALPPPKEGLYERKEKPPDALEDLLPLVGYGGEFSSLVKELALRRMRRIPGVEEALLRKLDDPGALAPERAWAAYALGGLRSRRAIPDLAKALAEKDLDLRGFAALALARMGDPAAWEAVLPLASASREDPELRCLVLLSLAPTDHPKAREVLAQVARKDPSFSARRAAILALGVRPGAEDRTLLLQLGTDRDSYIRAEAALALGIAGGELGTLRKLVLLDKDPVVRSHAALALGIQPSLEALPELLKSVKEEKDFITRSCAALALGRLGAPEGIAPLCEALEDRNAYFVSNFAALGLGLSGRKEALAPLARGLEARRNDLVNSCSTALAILADPEASGPLMKAQDNRQFADVRQFATLALARLKQPGLQDRFVADLDSKTPGDVVAAALALAIQGDPRACPELEKRLGQKDVFVRNAVALAFDLLTEDEGRKLTLGEIFKGDPRNQCRRRADLTEVSELLNGYLPAGYKLPVTP